ncbi:hypothetical protein [Mycolicibacterium sp. P1-5]|uniref:hypothetical protein n=1 Tax=Mycolicibacterium sp. P1-5 TaxID=2024617 RepID=UPI0011EE8A77|nr:hypothetical protein [Mycolicibacterium sp. P1-5]
MEVIGTLWSKGHLTVDLDDGGIELAEAARSKITSGQSLAAEGELQTREFVFEPITGMILALSLASSRRQETSIRVPLRAGLKVSDIPPEELVSSVQAALRRERLRRGRVNVLSVGFGSPALQNTERMVWVEVEAAARRDPDNDRLSFTVSETARWSVRSQQRLNAYFDQLAAEEPKHPALQAVLGKAKIEREPPQDLDDLFRRMRSRLDDLERVEIPQVPERHRWLSDWATQIEKRLDDVRQAQAKVSLVTRAEGHTWTFHDLIDSARQQIVLVVPDPDPTRIREFQPGLRRALDRGVQVVFLWGRNSNDTLHGQVENWLDELTLTYGRRLLRTPKSAKTDVCLVIQDDSRAMVGSHSILGRRVPSVAEASILVEPAEDGPEAPAAVAELLRWTKAEFAPWVTAQRIQQFHALPARGPVSLESGAVTPPLTHRSANPMDDFNAADVDPTSLPLWAAGWRDVYAALVDTRRQMVAKVAAVEVVRDAEHRTLLWEGLRDAQYRLVISDDQLSPRSAGPALARNLRERRAAGAIVLVAHPAPPRSEPAFQEFVGLARGANAVSVRHQREGGRLFVADDRVVVGSFSPLDDRRGDTAGRRTSQLGLRIRYEPLAADMAGLLGAREAADSRPEVSSPVPEPPQAITGAGAGIAFLLEARAAGQDLGPVAAKLLSTLAEPLAVLSTWREGGVPAEDLRKVAAAVLHAELGMAGEALTWADWLLEDAWSRNAFVEAALLSGWRPRPSGLPAEADLPLRAAAILCATLETGPLASEMAAAVFELGNGLGAQTAGAAALVCDVLVRGQSESRELLGLLGAGVAPAWRRLCAQVENFRTIPLPLSRFTAAQNRIETIRSLEDKRAEIVRAIDRIETLRNRFSFDTGIALHRQLFRPDGLLHRIRAAARENTSSCQELAEHLPRDVRRYLDGIVAAAGSEPMEWLKQVHFLHKIEGLVQEVHVIAACADDAEVDQRSGDHGLDEMTELGTFLGENWDQLYAEARNCGRPYELPALHLLTLLTPLTIWAKEQA